MTTTPLGALAVGVDSSPDSARAVAWTLAHAARTHQPVHFLHVESPLPAGEADAFVQSRSGAALLTRMLDEAELVPGFTASAQGVPSTGRGTGQDLLAAAEGAAMLVVGARGHGGVSGLLMGSVSQYVARHASFPVVAVRAPADPRAERVVVGVDDSDATGEALSFAFDVASRHRVPVTAIHAWHAPALHGVGVALPLPADLVAQTRAERRRLDERVGDWMQKYPEVTAHREVVPGAAGSVLTHASEHASLLVVGSRGRGAMGGMVLGSVSQHVLHHASCTVAIAR